MAYTKASQQGLVPVMRNSEVAGIDNISFDLDKGFSLMEMVKHLEANLDTPKPSKCFFVWSGRRQNEKQSLDEQQQRLVIQQIQNLGMAANEVATTKANLFLVPTMVAAIIDQKENEIALARQRFLVDKAILDDEIAAINHQSERRKHENEALEIANLKERAEVDLLLTKDKEGRTRIKLIRTVLQNIDFKTLDPALSTYIITTLANPNAAIGYQEHKMQGMLEDIIVQDNQAKMTLAQKIADLKAQEVEDKRMDVANKILNLETKRKKLG